MIARLCDRFEQARTATQSLMSRSPASPLKAYLSVTLDREPGWDRVAGGLLAAIANDLNLLKPVREHYERWLAQLAERPTFAREATVWLAGQGRWLLELLRVSPFNPKQRREVTRYLNAM